MAISQVRQIMLKRKRIVRLHGKLGCCDFGSVSANPAVVVLISTVVRPQHLRFLNGSIDAGLRRLKPAALGYVNDGVAVYLRFRSLCVGIKALGGLVLGFALKLSGALRIGLD